MQSSCRIENIDKSGTFERRVRAYTRIQYIYIYVYVYNGTVTRSSAKAKGGDREVSIPTLSKTENERHAEL